MEREIDFLPLPDPGLRPEFGRTPPCFVFVLFISIYLPTILKFCLGDFPTGVFGVDEQLPHLIHAASA